MSGPHFPLLIKHLLLTSANHSKSQEIVYSDVRSHTYGEFQHRISSLAAALTAFGVRPGMVVGVMDWDSHRYLECFFAVPMIGAQLHTINVRLSPEQILYTINHAPDDVLLVHEDFLPVIESIRARIERPVHMILLTDRPDSSPLPDGFVIEYETALASCNPAFNFREFDENTPATLFYTTGTTGEPKGVSFSHRQLVLHTLSLATWLAAAPGPSGFRRTDVYMPITPLFHVHGWGIPYVATLLGVKQVYPGRYEPAKLLELIGKHKVTFSHCVPTVLSMLLAAPQSRDVDLSDWKVLIGGSALSSGLAQAALDRGIDVHAAYGMSETCPLLTIADMLESHTGDNDIAVRTATGKAAPLVDLRIIDPDLNELAAGSGATGEIVVRSPWLTSGYHRNEVASEGLWRGGVLHTGDVGYLDTSGTLHITDRLKDVIKSGGEWISSLQLEDLASRCEGVSEVAAIGTQDDTWGERPALIVVPSLGSNESSIHARLVDLVRREAAEGRLSKWAVPKTIVFVDSLMKTSVGKHDKKAMRQALADGRLADGTQVSL